MKATRQEPNQQFIPVVLTLETQQEVDALYALLNHSCIVRSVGLGNGEYKALEEFRDLSAENKIH